jgi:hypothetical protein
MAVSAVSPDGRTWIVRRRLAPRLGSESLWGRFHKRYRKVVERTGDVADVDPGGCLDVVGEGIVAAIGVIVVVLVLIFIAIPLLVAIVDVVIVIGIALLGIGARIVLRRPWVVEASAGGGLTVRWRVVGWKASGERVDEIAKQIAVGTTPTGAESS